MSEQISRIALGIEYEGTAYKGFQKQNSTEKTIQGLLDKALSTVANQKIVTFCSGRTDAGVHAYCQTIHFDSSSLREIKSWVKGGNALLPKDIRILWAKEVSSDFHSRFSAISRTYRYIIRNSAVPSALDRNQTLWIREKIDLRSMRRASAYLIGENDFSSFRTSSCQSKTPYRNIHSIKIKKTRDLIFIEVTANAFLLNMVRIIIGTLLEVGLRKMAPRRVRQILETKDRSQAGKTSSPKGLYFMGTKYLKKYRVPSISNSVI